LKIRNDTNEIKGNLAMQYQPGKIGTLAQAIEEAIPEGMVGIDAAKALADFLDERGWVIEPKVWRCEACAQEFKSWKARATHKMDKHTPHLKYLRQSSKDRPSNLGNVPCGHCEQSFRNDWNAKQHRKMVHGIVSEE
jgi:hypothetical protein